MTRTRRIATLLALACAGACSAPPQEVGFDRQDPQARLLALRRAAAEGDRSAIPHLIAMLDADDPGIRMFAIGALEQMTGETMGYDHAAHERERREAVDRWVQWWRAQEGRVASR